MPEDLYEVFLNTTIIFVLLITLARIIGKKLLSQMTFFDFVVGIIIGTIGGAFVTTEVKGYYVLISPVILTFAVVILGFISLKSVPARKLLEGEPVVMVQNGKIFEKNMRNVRYHIDDLMMQLRNKDVFDLGDVEFAILEPNGHLSVLKKSQKVPVTPEDLGISTVYKGMSSEIIRDGQIVEQNLRQNNLSHQWLYNELASRSIKRMEDVILATLSTEGKLYIDLRKDNPSYIQEVEDDDSVI